MDIRISEMDDEEVDHLRYDRIKIQRKRMEHILEVIKDLTFKNKELIKQNMMLKEDIQEERRYKHSYQDVAVERKLLVERNTRLEEQLRRYKETMLHQQILITHLQQQLNFNGYDNNPNNRQTYAKENYSTEPQFARHLNSQFDIQQQFITSQDYEILKTQYTDLQKQYSKLFQSHFSRQQQDQDLSGYIYSTMKEPRLLKSTEQFLKKAKSHQNFEKTQLNNTMNCQKWREKYERIKKQKKDLLKSLSQLQSEIIGLKLREQNLMEVVDILKQKKTKICLCHINKLQKHLQLKASLLQNRSDAN